MKRLSATLIILSIILIGCSLTERIIKPLQDEDIVNQYMMAVAVTHPEWIPVIIEKATIAKTMLMGGKTAPNTDLWVVNEIKSSDLSDDGKLAMLAAYITLKNIIKDRTEDFSPIQIDSYWLTVVQNIVTIAERYKP